MGASLSTSAAPTVRAEAMMAAPPQGCPMHQEAQPVKVSPPAECPMHQAQPVKGINIKVHAACSVVVTSLYHFSEYISWKH
ncbi:hypothetical protein VZT92_014682 [Zoarces viviparus]|uniref:Uncharacterized protein n=1 Tax=Zoarces viviparus TaxID=48416 RepID=A0AAW1EZM9_ZOAVI